MLFITNRFPTQGIKSVVGRQWDFDLKNNAASNSVFYCERNSNKSYTEIGSTQFLERIKNSSCRQILIYIHGFSNLPEDVFRGAAEFQLLCDQKIDDEILVVPLIWPCDDDKGVVQDYWDDQKPLMPARSPLRVYWNAFSNGVKKTNHRPKQRLA